MFVKTAVLIMTTLSSKKEGEGRSPLFFRIAGESLIKRTVLSLQKAGIKKIILFSPSIFPELTSALSKDSRIKVTVEWITQNSEPVNTLLEKKLKDPFLLLNDNIIFNYQTLETFLRSNTKNLNQNKILAISKKGLYFIPKISLLNNSLTPLLKGTKLSETFQPQDLNILSKEDIFLEEITDKKSIKHAEKKLLRTLKSPSYGFLEKHVDRKISILFTRFFVKTPITPNQITIFSTFIGFLSVYFFISNEKLDTIWASLLFILSTIIDCSDGEVARIKFQETKYGSLLDIICDNLVQIPLFYAIAYGYYLTHNTPYILSIGAFAVIGSLFSFIMIFYNMWLQEKKSGSSSSGELSVIEKREYSLGKKLDSFINRDFCYIILIAAICDRLDWFLIATAIGSNILWVTIFIKKIRMTSYEKI